MNTVNIVEYFNNTINKLTAFEDNAQGNKNAEALFSKLAKENGFTQDEVAMGLDDGYLELDNYQLFIVHSS